MMRIVVSEFMDEAALADFGEGMEVIYDPLLVDATDRLIETVADADGLIVRNRTRVNEKLLRAAPKLKVVGRLGVGLENIDLDACALRGVRVCPATGANTQSVVEYVIGTMLSLRRGAYAANDAMIDGTWPRGKLGEGGEVSGLTLGLLGFGAIAQSVATVARSLGMRIAAHDPYLPAEHTAWDAAQRLNLEDLLAQADILSIHVPLTSTTRGLIGPRAISKMKQGAIVINTARGEVVDEPALVAALKSGDLAGAAVDVFASEPLTPEAGAVFDGCPNLILTPHIAGVTREANARVSRITVANVRDTLGELK